MLSVSTRCVYCFKAKIEGEAEAEQETNSLKYVVQSITHHKKYSFKRNAI